MFTRVFDLKKWAASKSCFLFGPRQTGKTSLISTLFPECPRYDLLKTDVYLELAQNPALIRQKLQASDRLIIIDEIQKLPTLLDEVHSIIEDKKIKFVMTGSSQRKLKSSGVNLLGGRARSFYLHPLIYQEFKNRDLEKIFYSGTIPSIYLSDYVDLDLKSYVGDYLSQEVAQEGAVRNIPAFSRFLELAALCNSKEVNVTKIANDALVKRSTLNEYLEILKETLISYELTQFKSSKTRKPQRQTKLYFFDVGVARLLQGRKAITPKTPEFGEYFEAYLFHELNTYLSYTLGDSMHYWRNSDAEVDFIVNSEWAIEAKAKNRIDATDLKSLLKFSETFTMKRYIVLCLEKERRTIGKIEIIPWYEFLEEIWS